MILKNIFSFDTEKYLHFLSLQCIPVPEVPPGVGTGADGGLCP
jgi:hypothetical protein